MVNTTQCGYSGREILPGYGKRLARQDKTLVIFASRKCAVHFTSKWNARKIRWTLVSRRLHGKEIMIQAKKKSAKKTAVKAARGYAGLSQDKLDSLRAKYQ